MRWRISRLGLVLRSLVLGRLGFVGNLGKRQRVRRFRGLLRRGGLLFGRLRHFVRCHDIDRNRLDGSRLKLMHPRKENNPHEKQHMAGHRDRNACACKQL